MDEGIDVLVVKIGFIISYQNTRQWVFRRFETYVQ